MSLTSLGISAYEPSSHPIPSMRLSAFLLPFHFLGLPWFLRNKKLVFLHKLVRFGFLSRVQGRVLTKMLHYALESFVFKVCC